MPKENLTLEFYKYHGSGNDFILVDARTRDLSQLSVSLAQEQIAKICDRHFGIGADGFILLNTSNDPAYDFEMKNYNADGSLSSMCGNGARTLIQFAFDLGLKKNNYTFLASDGAHEAKFENSLIHLKMQNVTSLKDTAHGFLLNTGSPHLVCFKKNVASMNVKTEGFHLRHHADFKPAGTNVNFIEPITSTGGPEKLKIRTFERGVEDETLSCGTGVIAAALVFSRGRQNTTYKTELEAVGGTLFVQFDKKSDTQFENIWLIGPAKKTFEGKIEL